MLPTKFPFIWPSGFQRKDSNVKSYQITDAKWWQKLTWSFGLDRIKRFSPATFLCLFQARTWISIGIYKLQSFLCSMIWGVVDIHFVDIGRFVAHHCLNFLFKILKKKYKKKLFEHSKFFWGTILEYNIHLR
jgi:hypothetical protein